METVNHPAHYNIPGRKECIVEMLEKYGIEKVEAFCELNAYKYEYRHELKNGQEDLNKADWYQEKLQSLEKDDPRYRIADHYGLEGQQNQLVEEMGELIQAISKINRVHGCGQPVAEHMKIADIEHNLIEELADVKLVLDQVIYLLGADESVQWWIEKKIKRTLERMGKE